MGASPSRFFALNFASPCHPALFDARLKDHRTEMVTSPFSGGRVRVKVVT
jgi:hypothetical protein